jgi:hypothetical protein
MAQMVPNEARGPDVAHVPPTRTSVSLKPVPSAATAVLLAASIAAAAHAADKTFDFDQFMDVSWLC